MDDKKREWPNYIKWISYLVWAIFLFSAVYDSFNFQARAFFWILELGIAVLIYSKTRMPSLVYIGILLVLLANLFGELYLELFYTFPNYDKMIHLLSPIAICSMLYFIMEKKLPDKMSRILLSAALLLSFEMIWEILEYFSDLYLNTVLTGVQLVLFEDLNKIQVLHPYDDTIYDMLFNLIGAVVFIIGANLAVSGKNRKY